MTRHPWTIITLLALCASGLLQTARAAENGEYQVPYDKLLAACEDYLGAFATEKDLKEMEKRLTRHVDTKVDDNPIMTRDRAMREIMLDWAAGNRADLEKKKPSVMKQACFYFKRFIEKNFQIPNQIRSELTPEVVKEILETLHGEAKKKREQDGKK